MTRTQKEIECIKRLFDVGYMTDEFLDFLVEEKVIDQTQLREFRLEKDKSLWIHAFIKQAQKVEKILLFDFEWVLLPIERIKITVVTQRNSKEFVYNANT